MLHRISKFISFLFLVSLVVLPLDAVAEEIVVTATPIRDESPAGVTAKSPTSFTQTVKVNPLAKGLTSTMNALRLSGSADLPEYGQSYLPSTVSLRGAKDQQTLIMLDGVPLTSSLGDPIDLSFYPIPEIDRIEIVKGSNSAAYGPSAMGGVVNIVTSDPGMEDSAEFTASKGTFGFNLYNLLVTTGNSDVRLLLNATRSWGDNDFKYERPDGTEVRRENNDFVQTSLLSKLWFDAGGWDTTLTGAWADAGSGAPGGEGAGGMYLTPDDEVEANGYFLLGSTSRDFGDTGRLTAKLSRHRTRTHNTYDSMWVAGDSWTGLTSDYLELAYARRLGILSLTPGAAWRRENLSSDQYGNHKRYTGSASLGSALDLDPFLLSLDLRYDNSSAFDGQFSWHAGMAWKAAPHLTLKANAGTGYHEPTMAHLYSPSSFTTFISNPDLRPEESIGFDIGPQIEFDRFGLGATYFVTRYDDLIKLEFDAGANTITYVNVDKAHASGVEAYVWARPADILKLSAGYILSSFRNGSGPYESRNLPFKPEQIFTLQADLMPVVLGRSTDLFVAFQFREGVYEDDANTEKTGNRNILDAGFAVEVVRHAVAAFKVNNILGDESVEYKSGDYWLPVPGRTYRGSLQVSF